MYKFRSLGLETNFLMDSFLAKITEKDNYFVVQTPKRESYFWGNYILMKSPPTRDDYRYWIDIFETEIGKRSDVGYCAITFDLGDNEHFNVSKFLENGFKVETDIILTATQIFSPAKINRELIIKEYDLKKNIDDYVEVHFDHSWVYGNEREQKEFLKDQALEFSKLIDENFAARFGGFLEDKLVADLGVYWNDNVIRFNSVSTHSAYRRLGVCSTLVYKVSKDLIVQNPNKTLVMQADEDYHAASIYESVGFIPLEKIVYIEWRDELKFGNN